MADTDWIVPGRQVCITGRGTAAVFHRHTTIERVTKTLIVCENGRRFRISDGPIQSVPYEPYGGFYLNPACQRKPSNDSGPGRVAPAGGRGAGEHDPGRDTPGGAP